MEPVSILLATGAIAVYAAHRAERMTERARRAPVTLPEMMDAPSVDDEAPVQVLAVHVRHARLARRLYRERLKIRVKYGDPGISIHCDTGEVTAMPPPPSPAAQYVPRLPDESEQPYENLTADFGTSCLFLGQRNGQNRIRLRLMKMGMIGRTVAKAELRIPALIQCSPWQEFEVPLMGPAASLESEGEVLGHLDLALETRVMAKGELRQYLKELGAEKTQEGFLMDIMPLAEGEVSDDVEDAAETPIVQGKLISVRHARRRMPAFCGLCKGRKSPTMPTLMPTS
eukprot:gb/GFBE01078993.1/.p1 GENE.gb/GFBE01078993.1/~~gb/GFBE01078993.1/.p1  ORF type:complete len:285 (+),score=42.13 gb/GFBE01078993.1/:1-855(+)